MSLTLSDCMTLSKVLNFSQLQFSAKQQIFNKIDPSVGYTNNRRTSIEGHIKLHETHTKKQNKWGRRDNFRADIFLAGHEFIP